MTGAQGRPEGAVGVALGIFLGHEQAVVAADHLSGSIADDLQEIGVGVEDAAVDIEADDSQRLVDCTAQGAVAGDGGDAEKSHTGTRNSLP